MTTVNTQNVNEQLGMKDLTDAQKLRFCDLRKRVSNGEISANQAYKYAQVDGDSPEDKGFKGSFKEWIETTKLNEWVSPSVSTDKEINDKSTSEKNIQDYIIPVVIGVAIAVVLVYAIKKFGKTQ